MDKIDGQVLGASGWAIEKADPGAACLRCAGLSGSIKHVKIFFRATDGRMMLGPWGAHFCLHCLTLFAEGSPPEKIIRPHAS